MIDMQPRPSKPKEHSFYAQFAHAKDYTLYFDADEEGTGPYWLASGEIDKAKLFEEACEPIKAIDLGGNRFQLGLKCLTLMSGLRLNWGDEFIAESLGNNSLILKSVVIPSPYSHFGSYSELGVNDCAALERILHALGGGWELLAGMALTITLPTGSIEAFKRLAQANDFKLSATNHEVGQHASSEMNSKTKVTVMPSQPKHTVLLGDSIFDNAKYVPDGKSVIQHLREHLTSDEQATLLAVDGEVAIDVLSQLQTLPSDATHIVVSTGGNDAIGCIPLLQDTVHTVEEALSKLSDIRDNFSRDYRIMLNSVLSYNLPTAVCTIHDAVPGMSRELQTALALFNEVILKEAAIKEIPIIDLRVICNEDIDYSEVSPIEPSHHGGLKIALAINRQLNIG